VIPRNPQRKVPNAIEEIIRQRMPLETASSLDNGSVIKTEVSIPRNSIVVNNAEMLCDEPRIGAVKNDKE